MAFFRSLDISGSGMTAQQYRMDTVAQNIANIDTTRTAGGEPYRRKMVYFQSKSPANISFVDYLQGESLRYEPRGVRVKRVDDDQSQLKAVFDPSHPDSGDDGYVYYPNVDTTKEMVDMMSATRSYNANLTMFNAMKDMAKSALDITAR